MRAAQQPSDDANTRAAPVSSLSHPGLHLINIYTACRVETLMEA